VQVRKRRARLRRHFRQARQVNALFVDARGRARLEAPDAEPQLAQRLGQPDGRFVAEACRADLALPDVAQPVQESACGQDDGAGGQFPVARADAVAHSVAHEYRLRRALQQGQVLLLLQGA